MITPIYLAVQSTYQTADIVLCDGFQILDRRFYSDLRASTHLVSHIDSFLTDHNKNLSDIAFIAIDKGPGAFTTLRVAIATINGIAFARSIPLIGVDGLTALHEEALTAPSADQKKRPFGCVSLLNAYNNDVYFIYSLVDGDRVTQLGYGCKNIDEVLRELIFHLPVENIFFNGNGFVLQQELIKKSLEPRVNVKNVSGLVASSLTIASLGYSSFKKQENITKKIMPHYLKTQLFAVKKTV